MRRSRLLVTLCGVQALALIGLIAANLFVIDRLGGLGYLIFKARNPSDASGWSRGRTETFDLVEGAPESPIVFLGDSITHQPEWSELLGNRAILNRGVDGDSTREILERLPKTMELKPKKILVMAGINDLAGSSPQTTLDGIKTIVDAIRGNGTSDIALQSVLPVNSHVKARNHSNSDVRALNEMLKSYAAERRIPYLDVYGVLVDGNGDLDARYTYDGIHLNGAAYKRWIELLRPEIPRSASAR